MGRSPHSLSKETTHTVAVPAFAEQGETTEMGTQAAYEMFGMENVARLDEHAGYTHLMRMAGLVYSAKEAMLDQLMDMVARGDESLERFGWDEDDYTEEISKEKFDTLWEQYQASAHVHVPFYSSADMPDSPETCT